MIKLYDSGVYINTDGQVITGEQNPALDKSSCKQNTIAYKILAKHNTSGNMKKLQIKFDAMTSHDITYVGIIQTARASGMTEFPIPYVLTNCHNSLCAVGGTINEDDHVFGLSAAQKYGGIYVPAHLAVIHQYMREMMSGCGKMILGSDSHTRYGALGTMAIGEGGPELVKQLLGRTYDVNYPDVVAIKLTGKPRPGVGPQDVALAIIGKVFKNGYVKNKVMEFIGTGIFELDVEYRNGIDVMTTETTCLSSIWQTDDKVREYYKAHGREEEYTELKITDTAYYDGLVEVDLGCIEPMIALPFHPSNVYTISELQKNPHEIINDIEQQAKAEGIEVRLADKIIDGKLNVQQGIIAGCAGGTYSNIVAAADIINSSPLGSGEFSLSVYPSSQPTYISLAKGGQVASLMSAGAVLKTAFCGPCFGAGDVPSNNGLSIRHTTRNFPNREGSKPSDGQIASVALMDARSIAATALNGGVLTSAMELDVKYSTPQYTFDKTVYDNRVYNGFGNPKPQVELRFGPNIVDWPKMSALTEHLLLKVCAYIDDAVTTTDELIPSGETSSYRSNPMRLAEFTLSRKVPEYVNKAKAVSQDENARLNSLAQSAQVTEALTKCKTLCAVDINNTGIGSVIFTNKPGDGSAREQAASCQKVLGGWANIAREYATKRYHSNLINWGMLPFILKEEAAFSQDDYIFIKDIKDAIATGKNSVTAYVIKDDPKEFTLNLPEFTDDEKAILLAGCLINFYRV